MSIAAKTPSREAEGGRYRTRGPSGVFARLAGTPPFESAGSASRRISASLSPGVTVSFIRGAACGCFLGGIGSGSTIGADWLEAAPYDWDPVGSSAMRALPKAAGTRRPKAEPEASAPASEGHEDESPVCRGANQREGEGSVKNSGDGQSSAESRLGALEARTEILQESVTDLTKKVEDGFERQRKEIKDGLEKRTQETGSLRKENKNDLEKQNKRIDDGFERQRKEIKDGLERQTQETGNLRKEIKNDLEKQNKRIDDGFERQRKEIKDGLEKRTQETGSLRKEIKNDLEKQNKRIDDGFERQRKEIKDGLEKQTQETGNLRKEIKDGLEKRTQETGSLRKEIKDDLEKQNKRIDDGFERQRKEIKDGLEKQTQETGNLRKEIKDDLEKQNKRIDDGFERQSREFNARLDKLLGAVWALAAAILVAVIGAVATDFFAGFF